MKIASIGIDKTTFHLVGLDVHGNIVIRRKFSRKALLAYTANLPSSLMGIEACGGAHCLARTMREQGHQARLIPGQFVKPYRKSNKNDYLDAEAIAEAVTRNNMRFVPVKTRTGSTCRVCIGCANDWYTTAPKSSTRFVVSCWSVGSPSIVGR